VESAVVEVLPKQAEVDDAEVASEIGLSLFSQYLVGKGKIAAPT
jgi:hypothetical protein